MLLPARWTGLAPAVPASVAVSSASTGALGSVPAARQRQRRCQCQYWCLWPVCSPKATLFWVPWRVVVTTAERLKRRYRAGELDEAELDRRLERLAEREGIDALTLPDPREEGAAPQEVERGMSEWFALAVVFVTVAVAVPSGGVGVAAVLGAALSVAAGVYSITVYSYRRGSLPRAAAP